MSKRNWVTAAVFTVVAAPALANEAHHPQSPAATEPSVYAEPAAESTPSADLSVHMEKMQVLLDQMRGTQDPERRLQMLEEHAVLMQEGMRMQQALTRDCAMMNDAHMGMMKTMMEHMHQGDGAMGQGMMTHGGEKRAPAAAH